MEPTSLPQKHSSKASYDYSTSNEGKNLQKTDLSNNKYLFLFGLCGFILSVLTAYKGLMTTDGSNNCIFVVFLWGKPSYMYEPFMGEKGLTGKQMSAQCLWFLKVLSKSGCKFRNSFQAFFRKCTHSLRQCSGTLLLWHFTKKELHFQIFHK